MSEGDEMLGLGPDEYWEEIARLRKKPFHHWTEEDNAQWGIHMKNMAHAAWNKWCVPHPTIAAINAIGGMAVEAFTVMAEFDSPEERLVEFDRWVKYTRERIEEFNRSKMS